jgi:EF hand
MRLHRQALLLSTTVLYATAAQAAPPEGRPDLASAKPIVACQLQTLAVKRAEPEEFANAMLYTGRPVEDPLSNYERTSLGDWPIFGAGERTDPWLRLVLLSRKRPVVIDLAVLIDGKSFREKRDVWIDELVSTRKPDEPKPLQKDLNKENGNNKSEVAGTKSAAKPSEGAANAEATKEDKKEDKAYTGPTTKAQSRQAPTMRERLADYLATNKTGVNREELGWLIAAWGAGPGVILLDPSLSWQRSEVSSLETYLDRNGDGAFSREEVAQAESVLKQADVDSNDVVDLNEIRRTIDHPAFTSAIGGHPLIVVLDANTDALKFESMMATIYKTHAAGAPAVNGAAPAITSLQTRPADITLQVNLGTSDKSASGVSVLSLGQELSKSSSAASATSNVATIDLDGDYIEFSAAQGAAPADSDSASSQIAIGGAYDGNPLLRLLDHDNDGRLTRRERQEISGLFTSFDRDGDGAVSSSEVPVPIRFAVTLGPHAHELLATPAPAARAMTPKSEAPSAPSWFKSMDKNSDSDLSRGEFLGTTEQFKQLDTNGDGLLSIAEALKFKTGK